MFKYGPEITPYLGTFHVVMLFHELKQNVTRGFYKKYVLMEKRMKKVFHKNVVVDKNLVLILLIKNLHINTSDK